MSRASLAPWWHGETEGEAVIGNRHLSSPPPGFVPHTLGSPVLGPASSCPQGSQRRPRGARSSSPSSKPHPDVRSPRAGPAALRGQRPSHAATFAQAQVSPRATGIPPSAGYLAHRVEQSKWTFRARPQPRGTWVSGRAAWGGRRGGKLAHPDPGCWDVRGAGRWDRGGGHLVTGAACCVAVVPRGRVREQDAHPGARGRRLEPLGRLEHVQPHVRDRSPLPAEEMRQPPVSAPSLPGTSMGLAACGSQCP